MGLDWPKTDVPAEQERSLREIVRQISAARFNTIYFQIRGRADAMYKPGFEPWSQVLTGTLGEDPGFDPLEVVIEEAHRCGMDVHAWFNTFLVKSGGPLPEPSAPKHVLLTHPEWIHQVNGEWWFDPGIPEVRAYNIAVAMDVVRRYDIDGFQFDFIRYPGRTYPDDQSYHQYGGNIRRDEWRRENINNFMRTFYDSVMACKPLLKIGAAPIGIYRNFNGVRGQPSYDDLYQDSRLWLREGLVDYLVPQVYWTIGDERGDPDFALVARDWSQNTSGRHVYIGVGAYKNDVYEQIPQIIDTTRSLHLQGNSFFRYSYISKGYNTKGRYDISAFVPPMHWKDSLPPPPPAYIVVNNISDGIFHLKWEEPPPQGQEDVADRFLIYRSPHSPVDISNSGYLIASVKRGVSEYRDTILHVESARYQYAVTSMDALHNESTPTVESIVLPEVIDLAKQWTYRFRLGDVIRPSDASVYIPYEVDEMGPVIIRILDTANREVVNVVDRIQSPGRYIAGADISSLDSGTYTCLLLTRDKTEKKTFRIN
jgi:uncharacterized lipoprotein YddW (UPF0748 family)